MSSNAAAVDEGLGLRIANTEGDLGESNGIDGTIESSRTSGLDKLHDVPCGVVRRRQA